MWEQLYRHKIYLNFGDEAFKKTILANSTTKVAFGNNTPEDNDFWSREFGDHREWKFINDYDIGKIEYSNSYKSIKWDWKENIKSGEVQALAFKTIVYKTKDLKGKMVVGKAKVDFLESKYKEKQKIKFYNFAKFTNGININETTPKKKNSSVSDDTSSENEPISDNSYNSHYKFDDEEPIINYKKTNS